MKIGIDGSCLSNKRGFGRFARQLLGALAARPGAHDFAVFVDGPSAGQVEVPRPFARVVVDVGEAPSRAASAQGRRRWRDMIAMGMAVARANVDLMYFPATYSFFPVWNVPRLVVTMHDTLTLTHPELVFPTMSGRLAWRLKEAAAVHRADRIVTVSEASRKAIQAWSGWPDHKIRVVTEGPDQIFSPRASDPEAGIALARFAIAPDVRYLLYVGGLSPHKNLVRLVEAFGQGAPGDVLLVIAGDFHDTFHTHVPEIRAAIDRHHLNSRVIMTGFVSDLDLSYLYSRAYGLVLPSLVEGFGLPAVEAMACGTPVVASNAGSLPEVIGDAGVFFDPTDVTAMARVIGSFLADLGQRHELARRAIDRAALFSWEASAAALLACFNELEQGDRSWLKAN